MCSGLYRTRRDTYIVAIVKCQSRDKDAAGGRFARRQMPSVARRLQRERPARRFLCSAESCSHGINGRPPTAPICSLTGCAAIRTPTLVISADRVANPQDKCANSTHNHSAHAVFQFTSVHSHEPSSRAFVLMCTRLRTPQPQPFRKRIYSQCIYDYKFCILYVPYRLYAVGGAADFATALPLP